MLIQYDQSFIGRQFFRSPIFRQSISSILNCMDFAARSQNRRYRSKRSPICPTVPRQNKNKKKKVTSRVNVTLTQLELQARPSPSLLSSKPFGLHHTKHHLPLRARVQRLVQAPAWRRGRAPVSSRAAPGCRSSPCRDATISI